MFIILVGVPCKFFLPDIAVLLRGVGDWNLCEGEQIIIQIHKIKTS